MYTRLRRHELCILSREVAIGKDSNKKAGRGCSGHWGCGTSQLEWLGVWKSQMLNEADGWQLKQTKKNNRNQSTSRAPLFQVFFCLLWQAAHSPYFTGQWKECVTELFTWKECITELFTWKECVTELSYECLKNEVSCFPDFQVALSSPSQKLASRWPLALIANYIVRS